MESTLHFYENNPDRIFFKISLKDLKRFFNFPKSYRMSDLNKTLNNSIKELNKKTNIKITYSKTKKRKEITHLTFNFSYVI